MSMPVRSLTTVQLRTLLSQRGVALPTEQQPQQYFVDLCEKNDIGPTVPLAELAKLAPTPAGPPRPQRASALLERLLLHRREHVMLRALGEWQRMVLADTASRVLYDRLLERYSAEAQLHESLCEMQQRLDAGGGAEGGGADMSTSSAAAAASAEAHARELSDLHAKLEAEKDAAVAAAAAAGTTAAAAVEEAVRQQAAETLAAREGELQAQLSDAVARRAALEAERDEALATLAERSTSLEVGIADALPDANVPHAIVGFRE